MSNFIVRSALASKGWYDFGFRIPAEKASHDMTHTLLQQRRAGVLLHPTSLPGPHGSGDFGPDAYRFVDWLQSAGQTLWQTLPLGPVGPGYSPYMGSSAFAGNPSLVAFEPLRERGWLSSRSLHASFDPLKVDYHLVNEWRMKKLREAFSGFEKRARRSDRDELHEWVISQQSWLDDYALFMALDTRFAGAVWPAWPAPLARREADAMAQARTEFAHEIKFWGFVQWQFDVQWQALRAYARDRHVLTVGDLPIFIAHHSADCWARPDLYMLDADGSPSVIAGVPPDFFSETGQRWGNPLYNWSTMKGDAYRWWIARMRRQFSLADIVRIDHFRGFVDYWEIPADEPTAIHGRWQPGPADDLFVALAGALGELPIIAEDLGIITPEVTALRRRLGFPGMKILQFGFSGDESHIFLPPSYETGTVVYTGTHDNDTVRGWWANCSEHERQFAGRYLDAGPDNVHWAMLEAINRSVANIALCQLQDVLGLDGTHRMNTPGTMGCWTWRFSWDWFDPSISRKMAQLARDSDRLH